MCDSYYYLCIIFLFHFISWSDFRCIKYFVFPYPIDVYLIISYMYECIKDMDKSTDIADYCVCIKSYATWDDKHLFDAKYRVCYTWRSHL